MLSYLPGEVIGDTVPWPAWAHADSTLVQVGQWMRRVHDATAAFVPPADERWFTARTMRPGWIVGHQDAAPYNAVMDGGRLAGFFDWDTASPSLRDDDLAFSALVWVPLTAPQAGERSGSPDVRDRFRRLHLLLDAYRYDSDRRAFGAVVVRRELEREAPPAPRGPGHLCPDGQEADLGYLFLPEAWGHSYAAEAGTAALGWFAGALPGEPVTLRTQTANGRSMRLAAKLGFTEVKRFQEYGAEQWLGVAGNPGKPVTG